MKNETSPGLSGKGSDPLPQPKNSNEIELQSKGLPHFGRDSQSIIDQAAALIQAGKLVAIPTETVYGLAANAFDPLAVAKIFAAKDRPLFDPLIVHIADRSWLPRTTRSVHPKAALLAERFWPGPLTLVLPKSPDVPDIVSSGLSTVGVRVPDHPITLEIIRKSDRPIAAPSANPFGRLSPTTAQHVRSQLGDRVDLIVDGGACRVGVESTIIQVDESGICCLRHGGISLEEIEEVVGPLVPLDRSSIAEDSPLAPGMLPSHYAPRTVLQVVERILETPPTSMTGLLTLTPHPYQSRY
ncbi:MAG: threonylcarbamoyl-AMP synthase, partial [Planctomycetes bacterium]|nr:threonylcarbamoyl-AMP synthase [Planctomycetota bacterium]